MRTIAVKQLGVLLLLACANGIASPDMSSLDEDTPFAALAKLATALSENDSGLALQVFDSKMKEYGTIETAIGALVAQADILCAIDVIDDSEQAGSHVLDVDWYMQLKSQADGGPSERRRTNVKLEMKQIAGKWKITAISPLTILNSIILQLHSLPRVHQYGWESAPLFWGWHAFGPPMPSPRMF